ncbi:MAG: SDR family oxidoreductase [Phycisphaerae bacterium]
MSERSGVKVLSGRTALVTGGARRLGRAIVEALATAEARVVVHYNSSSQEAEELVETLREQGRDAWSISADLCETGQADRLLPRASELCGSPIEVLVNSASVFPADSVLDVTAASLTQNMNLHTYAPLALARGMANQRRRGQILNMLDTRVVDYDRKHASYHLSKRGLFTLTRMLAIELAPEIAVNAVAPGLILPPPGEDETYLRRLAHTNPLNRHGEAADVVDAAMFLLGSSFITGQVIFVDGGRHLKGRVYD